MEFSKEIQQFLNDYYPDKDIEKMNVNELKTFIVELTQKRQEFMALEMAFKLLGNGAYGASASRFFYFYNVALAGDITGECRNLTLTMNKNLEDWFHEGIWNRKDLWKKFDFALDESKHDWYRQQHVWIYSDTDSIFCKSSLLIKRNGKIMKKTIEELFHENYLEHKLAFKIDNNDNREFCLSNDEVLNWTEDEGLHFVPINYIMKHKVSKAKFKIKTKSGKEIIVTGDHICIVFRDGKQLTVKASEINKDTDRILSVITDDDK